MADYLALSATKNRTAMTEGITKRYSPVAVLFLIISVGFGLVGGAETMVAFWAVIAIPMFVLVTVALGEWIAVGLRNYIGQLIHKRKSK